MESQITFRPIEVLVDSDDHEACLALADDRLAAVLVRLADPAYDPQLLGSWYLEAGFGAGLEGRHYLFASLEEAAVIIAAGVTKPYGKTGHR